MPDVKEIFIDLTDKLCKFWTNIKANFIVSKKNIYFGQLNQEKYKVHGSINIKLAKNNNCYKIQNPYIYNTKNRIKPLSFMAIIPSIYEYTNVFVEIILQMNGEMILTIHKDKENAINIINKIDKNNNIYINKIDITLFNININQSISKLQWIIQQIIHEITYICDTWIHNNNNNNNKYLNDIQNEKTENELYDDIYYDDEEAEQLNEEINNYDQLQPLRYIRKETSIPSISHDIYKRIHDNFDEIYPANDNNNNNKAIEDKLYDLNPNIEQEFEYENDKGDVENYKKLETSNLYNNILSKGFDNIYATEEDNIFDSDIQIDKCDNDDDDDDSTDDEYIYDEQKEGHQEIIDEKTYIFPREYKNIGPVFSYGKPWSNDIQAKYQHLKEEVLNNKYAPITEKTWNGILKKCNKILRGEFSSKRKNRWSKLLKDNKIGMKNLVALKLYTDFDLLQREFRKSFRAPYNKTKERLEAFYHWREALQETFSKFSNIVAPSGLNQPSTLFHGINSIMCLDQYEGTYYGPCSTTTDLHVARSFAGKNGMILVLKPQTNTQFTPYKVLDISWISDYPDEREYLLLDHKIQIETWILSSDYDQYYHYYHNTLTKKKIIKGPSGHLSYQNQKKIPKHLTKLKVLIQEIVINPNNNKKSKIKQNLDFNNPDLNSQEKIDLLIWMFQFALGYKYGKKKPSKYDQSLNANIQHVMKQIHIMQVPPKLVSEFMEQLRDKYQKDMSAYFIRSVLNEYFINTYCPLDAAVETTV